MAGKRGDGRPAHPDANLGCWPAQNTSTAEYFNNLGVGFPQRSMSGRQIRSSATLLGERVLCHMHGLREGIPIVRTDREGHDFQSCRPSCQKQFGFSR
jgi:hypothetical protein